jgi:hypothetical protein
MEREMTNPIDNLTAIAGGRSHINTAEAAKALNRSPQTLRKLYCTTGDAFGIRPRKLPGTTRLDWPVADIAVALTGGK